MQECSFKEEYRPILTKVLSLSGRIQIDQAQVELDDFEKNVLNLDLVEYYTEKGINFKGLAPTPMNKEDELCLKKLLPI